MIFNNKNKNQEENNITMSIVAVKGTNEYDDMMMNQLSAMNFFNIVKRRQLLMRQFIVHSSE